MVLLAFGHQVAVGPDFVAHPWFARYWVLLYGLTFGLIVIYRFATPLYNFWKHQFVVSKVTQDTKNSVSIYVTGRDIGKYKYEAGQFAHWYFLSSGLWWQGHPFSFSTSPNNQYLRITVKALGDQSTKLQQLKTGTRVIIDGPNGRFTPRTRRSNKLLMIAGGVGITPIRSIIEGLGSESDTDIVLLYGTRTKADISFRKELKSAVSLYGVRVHYVLSDDPSTPKQYIDQEVIADLVPDFEEREVYLCGPPPMMNSVKTALVSSGIKKRMIYSERFDF